MSNQSNTSHEKSLAIQDIINDIKAKSKGGGYIYRGEREHHPKVSSKLYRDFDIENEYFDIEIVQKEMLAAAKKHTGNLPQDFRLDIIDSLKTEGKSTEEAIDFEILTEIQHYGGKTNLIDFTTDYCIALFFACDGEPEKDGRVILQKVDKIRGMIAHPRNPRHRVIAQKSIFIRPPQGFIKPHKNYIVSISACLKADMLKHLRNYHGISTETIYNDLHGFIINQHIHGEAYTHFYNGLACGNRGYKATMPEEKRQWYKKCIEHYDKVINLKPDYAEAYHNRGTAYARRGEIDKAIKDYNKAIEINPDDADTYNNRGIAYAEKAVFDKAIEDYNEAIKRNNQFAQAYSNRGEARLHKKEWEKAKTDLLTARDMGQDIINTFHNDYENVEDFEQKTGIELPPDIAALLTPQ